MAFSPLTRLLLSRVKDMKSKSMTAILVPLVCLIASGAFITPAAAGAWQHFNGDGGNTRPRSVGGMVNDAPQAPQQEVSPLRNQQKADEPSCVDKTCRSQDDCCDNAACVTHDAAKVGVCAKLINREEGKICHVSEDCAPGLECIHINERFRMIGLCTHPRRIIQKKQYFDVCTSSKECDTHKGLCCREQPRISGVVDRKVCSYFEDPLEDCVF